MASGRPDFHPTMLLEGKYGDSLIPVLVDALGQLFTIISGNYGGVPTPVLLDVAGRILAHLVGNDGGVIRDVKVDASGKLIIRVQGVDGVTLRDVAVDPTGILLSRMKGYDGADLRDIKVDTSGNMLAIMKGLFGAELKTVAVDTDGIMKANLSAQDLNWLTVRPVYGQARRGYSGLVSVPTATWTTLTTINGKGATIFGYVFTALGVYASLTTLRLYIDGALTFEEAANNFEDYNYPKNGACPLYSLRRNDVTNQNLYGIGLGLTFETSFRVDIHHAMGANSNCSCMLNYALVPA